MALHDGRAAGLPSIASVFSLSLRHTQRWGSSSKPLIHSPLHPLISKPQALSVNHVAYMLCDKPVYMYKQVSNTNLAVMLVQEQSGLLDRAMKQSRLCTL